MLIEWDFFDELNIDVEYESFIGGPAMMEASASWDICDVGAPGILNGMKNYDIQMLGLCDNEYNTAPVCPSGQPSGRRSYQS